MKIVKIKLENNNDLKEMFNDLIKGGETVEQSLEAVMEEVQLRTLMIERFPEWAQQDTEIDSTKMIATVQMEKWDNL